MLTKLFICFFTLKVVIAQINGEFWWLNNKLLKLYKVEPPQPKFEKIGEFDTDESAKVVFRDDTFDGTEKEEILNETTTVNTKNIEAIIHFRDDSRLVNPVVVTNKSEAIETHNRIDNFGVKQEDNDYKDDVFNFIFPDEAASFKSDKNKTSINNELIIRSESVISNNVNNESETLNDKIFNSTEEDVSVTENICTYMKKSECSRCNGFPYIPEKQLNLLKPATNTQNICCILPLNKPKSSKIRFRGNNNRIKRSNINDNISPALKQRKNLMDRKYGTQTTASTVAQKIVTPEDEYIDPYLNIKNSNFKPKNYELETSQQDNSNDYIYNDYYAAELPKPSFVGLYSDHSPPNWSFAHPSKGFSYHDNSFEEEIPSFGYSTIDPRQGSSSIAPNFKARLLKLTTASDRMLNSESQIVSYHSNPDFQVLQGFKLLNLENKIKPPPVRNLRRTTTTESLADSGEKMLQSESSVDEDYDDYIDVTEPIYKNCGRTKENIDHIYNCDSALGESSRGAHPWLLLVTLSRRRQSILCYATLIHPRAAVTTADCTYEMKGQITIVAGAWDLREEKREHLQYRKPSVRAHQQYTPGKLDYNIALLYWRRPLRLDSQVQPACLFDETSNDCVFVGWGGYDQAIRRRPRWQRASILISQDCAEKMSNEQEFDLPIDSFCASVDSKTTVTGPGGPLMCRQNDVFAVSGLSVWRNHVVVLMRPQEWAIRTMAALRIN